MPKKKALGKGLGAIFKTELLEQKNEAGGADGFAEEYTQKNKKAAPYAVKKTAESISETAGHSTEQSDVSRETLTVRISLVEPNSGQPRKKFEEESLRELADSIKKYGVLQPLLVTRRGMMYEIVAGERRWRAAKLAGLKEIPVMIKELGAQETAEIALIENIQREDLSAVEEAKAYRRLIDEYGLKQEELAERVSKNRSTITNSLRLLQLSGAVLKALEEERITAGHARCLIPITDQKLQEALCRKIEEDGLNVRETEKLAKRALSSGNGKKNKDEEPEQLDMYLIDLARKLTASVGTKVMIRQGKRGKGKIEIDYYSNDDLEKIVQRLR